MDLARLAVLLLWGGGCLYFYGKVLRIRYVSWRIHHDSRAKRDLLSGAALFLVAAASASSIGFVLFSPTFGLRGVAITIALGAFVAAGWVMSQEENEEPEPE